MPRTGLGEGDAGRLATTGTEQSSSLLSITSVLQRLATYSQGTFQGTGSRNTQHHLPRLPGSSASSALPQSSRGDEDLSSQQQRLSRQASATAASSTGLREDEDGESSSADEDDTGAAAAAAAAAQGDPTTTSIDIRALSAWVEKVLPFAALLLMLFVWVHLQEIAVLAYLTAAVWRWNEVMKSQVALKEGRSLWLCPLMGGAAAAHTAILLLLYKQQLWRNLIMTPLGSNMGGVWQVIFTVMTVDALLRSAGFAAKCVVLLAHPSAPEENFRRRSQVLSLVEQVVLMYRTLVTVPCWLFYFQSIGMGDVLTSCLNGVYLWFKARILFLEVMAAYAYVRAIVRRQFVYGQLVAATDPQLMESGRTCPICQDSVTTPIKLTCNHLFCDACISQWLARERTCPMCRTIVRPAGTISSTDGATSLLPLVF